MGYVKDILELDGMIRERRVLDVFLLCPRHIIYQHTAAGDTLAGPMLGTYAIIRSVEYFLLGRSAVKYTFLLIIFAGWLGAPMA